MALVRYVSGRLKRINKTELSPLELTRALAERLNVRIEEYNTATSNNAKYRNILISKTQANELCMALSLLIKELEDAEETLLPRRAADSMTNVSMQDFHRWKQLYKGQRRRYRELALRFTRTNSILSESDTEALFEELDNRIIKEILK